MKTKIAIVDDHSLFLEGLERILQDDSNLEIIAKCNSAEELTTKLNEVTPHLVLLDIRMKGQSGLDFCSTIKEKSPFIKVILISMFESPEVIEQARQSGADGYLPKSTDADLVKSSIQDIINGHKVFLKPTPSALDQPKSPLSAREKEIICWIKQGMSSREISEKLFISQYTVNTHRRNILTKLGLSSYRELIVYATENHL